MKGWKRTKIKDLLANGQAGTDIQVQGWVRTRRGNKNVSFIALNDGSTIHNIQVVVDLATMGEEILKDITTGACIGVCGQLVESPGSGQRVEVQARSIEVFGTADPNTYPLQKKGHSMEFSARLPTCARVPTPLARCYAYAMPWLSPCTSSITIRVLCIYTHRLSPPPMPKVRAQCFR